MRLNELLLDAMNREVERSRWALEAVPSGRYRLEAARAGR